MVKKIHTLVVVTFTILLFTSLATAAQVTGWQDIGGLGNAIAVGANGTVYVLGTNKVGADQDFGIHKWNGKHWEPFSGGGVRIAVDPNGNPWVVNSVKDIYRWTGGGWQKLPGKGNDIAVGANGTVYVLGTNKVGADQDFGIHKWNGKHWEPFSGGGVRIAVDPNGNPWVVNSVKDIYRWTGGGWQQLSGKANAISIGANGEQFVLGTNLVGDDKDFGIHRWNGGSWEPVSGGGVEIAVDPDGAPAVVNSKQKIFLSTTTKGTTVWDRIGKAFSDAANAIGSLFGPIPTPVSTITTDPSKNTGMLVTFTSGTGNSIGGQIVLTNKAANKTVTKGLETNLTEGQCALRVSLACTDAGLSCALDGPKGIKIFGAGNVLTVTGALITKKDF